MSEHPIVEILRKDREKEDNQATESVKDYHTTITYLGAGALGFFLTIHEKFFQLQNGKLFWLFIISLALLFLSLLLYLVHIRLKFSASSKLRDKMDEYIETMDFNKTTQAENDAAKKALDGIWEKGEKISRGLMFFRLNLVLLGIATEIVFIALNISTMKSENEKPEEIKIELPVRNNSKDVIVDTSVKHSIQITF